MTAVQQRDKRHSKTEEKRGLMRIFPHRSPSVRSSLLPLHSACCCKPRSLLLFPRALIQQLVLHARLPASGSKAASWYRTGAPKGRSRLAPPLDCACALGSRALRLKTLAPLKTFTRPEGTRLRTAHQWRSPSLRQLRPGADAPTPGHQVFPGPKLPQTEMTTIPRRTEAGFISAPFCLPRKRLVVVA